MTVVSPLGGLAALTWIKLLPAAVGTSYLLIPINAWPRAWVKTGGISHNEE